MDVEWDDAVDVMSARQRADWRALHTRWLRSCTRMRRVSYAVLAFNALCLILLVVWATMNLPGLWWLYLLTPVGVYGNAITVVMIRRQNRDITQERAALAALSTQPHVERRTFAAADFEAERARALRDAFATGHIIVGRVVDTPPAEDAPEGM